MVVMRRIVCLSLICVLAGVGCDEGSLDSAPKSAGAAAPVQAEENADHVSGKFPSHPYLREYLPEEGRKCALSDIKAANPRILYYGQPWSFGKPLIDDATGLPIRVVAGCVVTSEFSREVDAYNTTVREWAKEHLTMTVQAGEAEFGEIVNGLQVGLSLRAVAMEPEQAVVLVLTLRNAGTEPLRVLSPHDWRKYWHHIPVKVEVKGKAVPCSRVVSAPRLLKASAFVELESGDTHSAAIVVNPEDWELKAPFEVNMTFAYENNSPEAIVGRYYQRSASEYSTTVDGLWVGKVHSNKVNVKLTKEE